MRPELAPNFFSVLTGGHNGDENDGGVKNVVLDKTIFGISL